MLDIWVVATISKTVTFQYFVQLTVYSPPQRFLESMLDDVLTTINSFEQYTSNGGCVCEIYSASIP